MTPVPRIGHLFRKGIRRFLSSSRPLSPSVPSRCERSPGRRKWPMSLLQQTVKKFRQPNTPARQLFVNDGLIRIEVCTRQANVISHALVSMLISKNVRLICPVFERSGLDDRDVLRSQLSIELARVVNFREPRLRNDPRVPDSVQVGGLLEELLRYLVPT